MATPAPNEPWREKYFESLSRLETEQRQHQAMEASLKRLAGRLCTACLGQSAQLDEQIRKLQAAIRRDVTTDELEKITPALTEAIHALDRSGSAPPLAPAPVVAAPRAAPVAATAPPTHATLTAARDFIAGDESIRAILAALLTELRRDAGLANQIDALDAKLGAPLATEQFPELLSSLTQLVDLRIKRIESARQEMEALLGHMVGKLDQISQFVADQHRSQSESRASSETLNIQLAGEIRAMGESVDSAGSLPQIRAQVRSRLDSIDHYLQEFRQREAALTSAMRERNEQMSSRIAELEAEANRLHHQLKDEQRLSTIDALTGVANRLAWEKRMDEELKRWRRFRQPTCIAVWDVDRFKSINDAYGHRAGDRVLRTVADCFARRIRGTDFLARYGGEEFVMILPGTKLDDAMRVVEELRMAIENIGFHFRGAPVSVTISSGVTALLADDSADSAFDRADKALYQAKERGRNRSVSI